MENLSTLTKQLGSGIPFRLSQALPNQPSCMNDAPLQPLHGTLAPCVRRPDLFPQLFNDGQQLSIFALGCLTVPRSLGVA